MRKSLALLMPLPFYKLQTILIRCINKWSDKERYRIEDTYLNRNAIDICKTFNFVWNCMFPFDIMHMCKCVLNSIRQNNVNKQMFCSINTYPIRKFQISCMFLLQCRFQTSNLSCPVGSTCNSKTLYLKYIKKKLWLHEF